MKAASCCRLLIVVFALVALGSPCVHAWWDEGHMLVGMVADAMLREPERRRIISKLLQWGFELRQPPVNVLAAAAVWPDHLKCSSNVPEFCRGGQYLDALEIFNKWHYVDNMYNPDGLRLVGLLNYYPLPETGAVWALEELARGFRSPSEEWHSSNESTTARPNRHDGAVLYPPAYSVFGWNFRLRNIIHILGDLHQPLHSVSAVSWLFPSGDAGGVRVPVNVTSNLLSPLASSKISNLHALWDSCGGLYHRSLLEIPMSELVAEALAIMRQFPPSIADHSGFGFEFRVVESESQQTAKVYAYPDVLLHLRQQFADCQDVNGSEESAEPNSSCAEGFVLRSFHPSDRYIERLRHQCRGAIARAGYRVADILQRAVHAMWLQDETIGWEFDSTGEDSADARRNDSKHDLNNIPPSVADDDSATGNDAGAVLLSSDVPADAEGISAETEHGTTPSPRGPVFLGR